MRAGLAFYRLLWRPAVLGAAWMLLSIGPILVLTATDGRWSEASRMLSEGPAARSFGLLAAGLLALPASAGVGAAFSILELHWCPFAWMLPGLRRRLFLSVVPFAVLLSLPGATLAPSFGAAAAVLVLGLVMFGLGLALLDRAESVWVSRAAVAALIAAGLTASRLLSFALSHPAAIAAIGLPVAFALLHRALSPGLARARPLRGIPVVFASTVGLSPIDGASLWQRLRAWSADGKGPVLGPWLGAALFERQRRWFGPSLREVGAFTVALVFFVGFAALSEPEQSFNYLMPLLLVGLMKAMYTAPYLEPALLQPLTRRQRARIEYVASTLDQVAQLVTLGLLTAAFGWPLRWFRPGAVLGAGAILRALAAAWIASPLIQHLRLGGTLVGRRVLMPRSMARYLGWTTSFAVCLALVWIGLGRVAALAGDAATGRLLQVATAFALLAVSQAAYAYWLFRLHRRGDLI